MLQPSWKERLNYETAWMSRAEIVHVTYNGAEALVDLKLRHGLVTAAASREIKEHIGRARTMIVRLDQPGPITTELATEIHQLNGPDSLCGKRELDWRVIGTKYRRLHCLAALAHPQPSRLELLVPPLSEKTTASFR